MPVPTNLQFGVHTWRAVRLPAAGVDGCDAPRQCEVAADLPNTLPRRTHHGDHVIRETSVTVQRPRRAIWLPLSDVAPHIVVIRRTGSGPPWQGCAVGSMPTSGSSRLLPPTSCAGPRNRPSVSPSRAP